MVILLLLALPGVASGQRRAAVSARPGDAARAITLACHDEGVTDGACAGFRRVAWCESRLDPNATNGQYKGLFQLSPRHRSDPIIVALGWHSAYGEAVHTIRYVVAHGWGEWSCGWAAQA